MSLGQKIVRLRKQKNLKQGDLAAKLGVTQRQLLRWEKDEVRPRPKAIEDLSNVFGIAVEELTTGAASEPKAAATVQDTELLDILSSLPELEPARMDTLKGVLRDMIACQQMSRFTRRAS